MSSPISTFNAGLLFAIASAALFAIRAIFVKLVYAENVDPLTLIAFRMLFSLPLYTIVLLYVLKDAERRTRLTKRNVILACVVGFLGYYSASYLDLLGLQYVTAQLGRVVLYTYPTFVVILGLIFFSEKISLRTIVALLVTYSGVLLIFGHDISQYGSEVKKGVAFILLCALSFAFYLVLSKPLIKEMGSQLFTSIALIAASVAILCHYCVQSFLSTGTIAPANMTSEALFWIFIIAIFCTVIPTYLTTAAVANIGAEKTGIAAMIGPAFTSLFAVLILHESFTLFHLAGISLTVFGVWILKQPNKSASAK